MNSSSRSTSANQTIYEILGRNSIHPFPARMAPGIALQALGDDRRQLRVLDPMAGSGTVLAVARSKAHKAFGFDLDPLAVLLAGVWTRTIDSDAVTDKAENVLVRAKTAFPKISVGTAYPWNSDEETREFIRYWFDPYARRQLSALSTAIARIHDSGIRDALWVGFSRLIITKTAGASLAMDLSHSRPHKKFERAPVKPFSRFLRAVGIVVSNCPQTRSGAVGPQALVKEGDARQMDLPAGSIDLVLTSPPYLNAIDYLRCSKFSLVWMGYTVDQIRRIRSSIVGAEHASEEALESPWVKSLLVQLGLKRVTSSRDQTLLARYVHDMGKAIAEVSRVLRRGGHAVYVVGESGSRDRFVRNSSIVAAVAEDHGLRMISRHSRVLPANRRYLPPPKVGESTALDGRLHKEIVLEFRKL